MTAFMASSAMWSQVTLPAASPYSQNFNATPGTSGTSYPAGWNSYNGTSADNTMNVGNAASQQGANYNFGSRVGILGSGSAFSPGSVVLRLASTSGKTGLRISYDVIKIREQARSNSFSLEVSTTSATAGFTPVTGGAYVSGPIAEGTVTPYANIDLSAVDNTSGNVWIRWSYTEVSGSGSRDGIALDNVVLEWGAAAPVVTTAAATGISATSATLSGSVNANGATVNTSFNWGTTTTYGNSVTASPSPVTGMAVTGISAIINSLTPNTQYNFRAAGTDGTATYNGSNFSFYTLANVPDTLSAGNAGIYTVDVTIPAAAQNNNPAYTQYAIQEGSGQYIQANGSLGTATVWQTAAQWGTVTVTGLEDNTAYSFSAKARNNAATPVETSFGPSVSVSTLVNTLPTLTAGTVTAFDTICIATASAPKQFAVNGINLTADDIVVGPTEGFTFSDLETGTYTDSLVIPQTGGTFTQNVFVRFKPSQAITYNDSISVSGGAAPAVFVTVTGTAINTPAVVTTSSASAAGASSAQIEAQIVTEGCSTVTERGIVYSTTSNPEINSPGSEQIPDALSGAGNYTFNLINLTGGTVYFVRAYGIDNSGIIYGEELTFTTSNVAAPVAIAATAITTDSFTANWDAADGALDYRVDVSESATFGAPAQATDLFFSEYAEGSSTNKYLEIFNGTGDSINLADYRIRLYSNGSSSATGSSNDVQLSGILASGNTVVLKNASTTLYTGTATVVASVNFNGNDAIALYKISTASNVDIFGRIGQNPGTAWIDGDVSTLDKTLVRKPFVTGGVTSNPVSGFPTLATEWEVLNQNDVTNLGAHNFAGVAPSFVAGYENVTVNGLSLDVTGLTASTQYYYRVRAVGGNTSANSNTVSATTAAAVNSTRLAANSQNTNSYNNDSILVYGKNGILSVISSDSAIQSVIVYDLTGKVLFASDAFNDREISITTVNVSKQILIVKAVTAANKVVTKKIVF